MSFAVFSYTNQLIFSHKFFLELQLEPQGLAVSILLLLSIILTSDNMPTLETYVSNRWPF